MNSRAKGVRGELMLRDRLAELGVMAQRTQQYCGAAGDSDVSVAGLELHVECKNTANVRMREWVLQCRRDARGAWVLCYHLPRSPGLPNGEWLVIQPLATWADDSQAFSKAREHKRAHIERLVAEAARQGF